MPKYHVSILNEHFTSDEELDSANMDDALKLALKGALDIASEHVSSGQPFFGAHLTLKEGAKEVVQMVVSVGAAPLKS